MRRRGQIPIFVLLLAVAIGAVFYYFYEPHDLLKRYERLALLQIDGESPSLLDRMSGSLNLPLQVRPIRPDPVKRVMSWEKEFAKDPRYWQLRKNLDGYEHGAKELMASIDHGVYDAASFEAVPVGTVERAGGETKVLSYFDKAIACNKDNGWYYYRKADYLMSLGEIANARKCLRAGNAAAKFYVPLAFPASEAYREMGKPHSKSEKAALGFIISEEPVPNYIRMKDQSKAVNECMALGYPLTLGDEMLTRARRMGQGSTQDLISHNVAKVLAEEVLDYARSDLLDLTPAQEQEFQDMKQKLDSVIQVGQGAVDEAARRGGGAGYYAQVADSGLIVRPFNRADYARAYEDFEVESSVTSKYASHFDCLDPPPLAIWASGKTVAEYKAAHANHR